MQPNTHQLARIRVEAERIRRSPSAEGHVDALATLLVDLIDTIDDNVEDYICRNQMSG